jgi:hypothetical protein
MHRIPVVLLAACGVGLGCASAPPGASEAPLAGPSWDFKHGDLKVSESRRFLVHADGAPFFWLGDTAWELFHRLTREEAERYLENRRQRGFTVIQAVALAEFDGLNEPNAYGHKPLAGNDPATPDVKDGPQNDYWDHVDWVVAKAREKGLYVGLLPTWGDKVVKMWGIGPVVFTVENARAYGRFLGTRYKDAPNVVWILGGDRPPKEKAVDATELWRAMAAGLKEGDGGRHLKTYHPMGGCTSAQWFHADDWLDFNMLQSGHNAKDLPNYRKIEADYNRQPPKPCLDGEPRYEDHPVDWKPAKGWFDDYDVRQAAYWALFAGAFGHTYGCHDIWQFLSPARPPVSAARTPWGQAAELPGAWHMLHVRRLMLSRPFLTRVPDPSVIAGDAGTGADHAQSTRDASGAYAFIYLPTGKNVTVDLSKISGGKVKAWWFDPRTGEAKAIGELPAEGTKEFDPPGEPGRGNDWVLVLDDAMKGFAAPGIVK